MSITNGYTDLTTLKFILDIEDSNDDTYLEKLVEKVSRWIDDYTHRRFYAANETRYYTAESPKYVEIDDCLSLSALVTDDAGDRSYSTTWTTNDYELLPLNAAVDGEPFDRIGALPGGDYYFPSCENGVKATGSFGYSATTPLPVEEACLLQCHRLWKRKDAPFGVSGPNQFGQVQALTTLDPDVKQILDHYVREI